MDTTKIDTTHWLRTDAAASYDRMRAAGMPAGGVASAGRTWDEQAALRAAYERGEGNLAARPGTSLHESGIALDVTRGTPAQLWMTAGGDPWQANASESIQANRFGWFRTVPSEAWHFSYDPAQDRSIPAAAALSATSPALPILRRNSDGGAASRKLGNWLRAMFSYASRVGDATWVGSDKWVAMQAFARRVGLLEETATLDAWGPKCWAAARDLGFRA